MLDPLVIVTIIGIIVPVGFSIYLGLSRRAHDSENRETERRLTANEKADDEHRAEITKLRDKLSANDLVTERLLGKLALEEQKHGTVAKELEDIKDRMATRDMLEATNKKLDQLLVARGYTSSSGRYGIGAQTASPPPPKGERER